MTGQNGESLQVTMRLNNEHDRSNFTFILDVVKSKAIMIGTLAAVMSLLLKQKQNRQTSTGKKEKNIS